jgi:hypothetical protein
MSKGFKIPKTIGQAVAMLLTKRRGLHPKCNYRTGSGLTLCKKPAVCWIVFIFPEHHGILTSGESLCTKHYHKPHPSFETIVFNSWDEIQVFQVMQS